MLRRAVRPPRTLATGVAVALAGGGILALAGCSSSPGAEPANSTVAPTLSFETERLDKLYRAALAQGEHLGATGWRSGGWVQNDRTTSRTWCSGGTGDAGTCTGLGDADGTHAQSAYQVSIELSGSGGQAPTGGLAVDIAFRSTQAPARVIRYRETSYASAEPAGFSAAVVVPGETTRPRPTRTTTRHSSPSTTTATPATTTTSTPSAPSSSASGAPAFPTAAPGELVVYLTETPTYQPTYVDSAGMHTAIGTPQGLGSTVLPAQQLKNFTSSAGSLTKRMNSRLSDLYAETRYLLKIKNSDQGICAVDGRPNCPPAKLTAAERNSAFADLDDWYNAQRHALRAHADQILAAINGPVDWAAFVAP